MLEQIPAWTRKVMADIGVDSGMDTDVEVYDDVGPDAGVDASVDASVPDGGEDAALFDMEVRTQAPTRAVMMSGCGCRRS